MNDMNFPGHHSKPVTEAESDEACELFHKTMSEQMHFLDAFTGGVPAQFKTANNLRKAMYDLAHHLDEPVAAFAWGLVNIYATLHYLEHFILQADAIGERDKLVEIRAGLEKIAGLHIKFSAVAETMLVAGIDPEYAAAINGEGDDKPEVIH